MASQPKKTILLQNVGKDGVGGTTSTGKTSKKMMLSLEGVGDSLFGASVAVQIKPPGISKFMQAHYDDGTALVLTTEFVDLTLENVPRFSDIQLVVTGGDTGGTTDLTAIIYEVE